ncbi:plasmid replication protein [Azospirillum largimobile]
MTSNSVTQSQVPASTLQLALWSHEPEQQDGDARQTNAVGLYDLAPRFVFASGERGGEDRRDNAHVESVTRSFAYNGEPYVITLDPARVTRRVRADAEDGGPAKYKTMRIEALPGEREQVVEEVIRRLATERARLVLVDGDNRRNAKVQMRFSFYEIQKELARVRRTLSITEIKEALLILSKTFLTIEQPADHPGGSATLLQSTAFPVVAMRGGKGVSVRLDDDGEVGGNTETYLEFNPLVAKAIMSLKFQSISYEMLMKIRNPVSWWLYKSLSLHYHSSSDVEPMVIRAGDIITNSGMNRSKRHRDTLRAIKVAVEVLVTQGVLAGYEKESERGTGPEIVDVTYALRPSEQFLEQIHRGKALAEQNARSLRQLAKPEDLDDQGRPRGPIPIDRASESTLRRDRRTLLKQIETDAPSIEAAAQG